MIPKSVELWAKGLIGWPRMIATSCSRAWRWPSATSDPDRFTQPRGPFVFPSKKRPLDSAYVGARTALRKNRMVFAAAFFLCFFYRCSYSQFLVFDELASGAGA